MSAKMEPAPGRSTEAGAIVSATGAASAATVMTTLIFIASSIANLPESAARRKSAQAAKSLPGLHHRIGGADLLGWDRAGRPYLLHQIVVPFAFHLDMGGGTEFDRLDQIVIDIGVDAGLAEGVER